MRLPCFLARTGLLHTWTYITVHTTGIYPEARTEGQTLLEYALLLGLLASLVVSALMPAGSALATIFIDISTTLAGTASPICPPGTFCIH